MSEEVTHECIYRRDSHEGRKPTTVYLPVIGAKLGVDCLQLGEASLVPPDSPDIIERMSQVEAEQSCECNYWQIYGEFEYHLLQRQNNLIYYKQTVDEEFHIAADKAQGYGGCLLEILTFLSYPEIHHPDSPPILAFWHDVPSAWRLIIGSADGQLTSTQRKVGNIPKIQINDDYESKLYDRGYKYILKSLHNLIDGDYSDIDQKLYRSIRWFARGVCSSSLHQRYIHFYTALEILLRDPNAKKNENKWIGKPDYCIRALMSLEVGLPKVFEGAYIDPSMFTEEIDIADIDVAAHQSKRGEIVHKGSHNVPYSYISNLRDIAFQCISTVLLTEDFRSDHNKLIDFVKSNK